MRNQLLAPGKQLMSWKGSLRSIMMGLCIRGLARKGGKFGHFL